MTSSIWVAHFSSLQLDRLRLQELAEQEASELRAHLPTCSPCADAFDQLSVAELLPPLKAKRPLSWKWTTLMAGVAAAAAMLIVLRPANVERRKGSEVALGMYVQHEGFVRRAAPGEVVSPGDALRFTATSPGAYVAVLSLDPRGVASIYFPIAAIPAGTDVALPSATRLDDTVGEERIVALFCDAPVDLEPVRASLGRGRLAAPDGCQVAKWNFVKR
jgi:hypothetical protein